MRTLTFASIVIVAAAFAWALSPALSPSPARCAWCPSYTCYARCTPDCACVSSGRRVGGQCVSFLAVPEYESRGWEVVP